MVLKNISKKTILATDLKEAKGIIDSLLGLLKKSNSCCLLFKTRFGIHTFFLKQPIDVLILDNNFQVVKIKENLKPNRVFFWNPRYYFILELPGGVVKKTNTGFGDKLTFLV